MPSKMFSLVISGIIFSLATLTPNFQQVFAEDIILEYPDFNINATQGEIQKVPTIPPLEPKASLPQLIVEKELPDPGQPEVEEEEIVEEIEVEEILVEEIEEEGVEEVDTITIIIIIVVAAAIVIAIIRRK